MVTTIYKAKTGFIYLNYTLMVLFLIYKKRNVGAWGGGFEEIRFALRERERERRK